LGGRPRTLWKARIVELERIARALSLLRKRRPDLKIPILLGRANKSSPSISIAAGIKSMQEHIDALDVAIADEKKTREAFSAAARDLEC
jgi:hypothetical protein